MKSGRYVANAHLIFRGGAGLHEIEGILPMTGVKQRRPGLFVKQARQDLQLGGTEPFIGRANLREQICPFLALCMKEWFSLKIFAAPHHICASGLDHFLERAI